MTSADQRAARLEEAIRRKRATARSGATALPARPADEPARLGEMQRGLWLLHQLDPASAAYNLASAHRLRGPVDAGELERALNQVVARHRLLRSTYRARGDEVLQVVGPAVRLAIGRREVEAGEATTAAVRAARGPFDLGSGPLVRMTLIAEAGGADDLLLLVLPHILCDQRSLGVLWRELAEAYAGRLSGSPEPFQYDDWVHRSRGDETKRREDLAFWRRRLDPLPEALELPFETPAGPSGDEPGARGRLLSGELDPDLLEGVRHLAAAVGASPFAVYAFAFRLLLDRLTDGRPVAFATPASTRSHPATANLVGYFLNPVVVPAKIDEAVPARAAIREFGREVRELLGRASVPFQTVAEELSSRRHGDRHPILRNPIFQALFVHRVAAAPPSLGRTRLEPVELDLGESKFDLTLFVTEGERRLEVSLECRTDRVPERRQRELLGYYATLLEGLLEEPERPTAELSMLRPEEAGRLAAWSKGDMLPAEEAPLLPARILERALRSPDSTAVEWGGRRRSYAEVSEAAGSIAGRLAGAGARPGDRVGLFLGRSDRMVSAVLGIHRAGAAYVPLDPAYPAERNRRVLEDADVSAVVTDREARDRLPAGSWPVVDLGDAPPAPAELPASPELRPEMPAYVLYTSGSTGRPKGVVVSHGNLATSTAARPAAYDLAPERFLLVPSVAFDSSVAGLFWTLATGGTLVVPTEDEAADPRRLADLVARAGVTGLLCVPSLYRQLLRSGADRLRSLAFAIVAGETCPPRLVAEHFRALPATRLFNEYGPTEATVWATVDELTVDDSGAAVPIGRPIPGVWVEVLDRGGRPAPPGIPGEARIAGPTVARGYHRSPELSAERFVELGDGRRAYRTGDRMAWADDGSLRFLGRRDEQIKLRGFRIEPGEVETALLGLPGVEEAAVVARTPRGGSPDLADPALQLVAFVRGGAAPPDWRGQLASSLPAHMVPSRLVELPELPLLPNGKVDRRRLRELPLEAETAAGSGGDPERILGQHEQALLSLWEGLLGRTGLGLTDNFFEHGAHSLLMVEALRAIERDFGVSLAASDLFECPTVEGLVRRIDSRIDSRVDSGGGPAAAPYHHLFPIQPSGGGAPLVFALPHFFTAMLAERFRGERPVYGLRGVGLRPEGNLGRWRTMRALAEELVEEIQRRFPGEACILAGYSFGASMALEAVRVLEERGLPVRRLVLIAPMPLNLVSFGPLRLQLDGLRRPGEELSAREALGLFARANHPLTGRPYRRAWRWLAVEPRRRLLQLVGRLRRRAGLPLGPRILHADVRVDRFRLHARYRPGVVHTPTLFFNAREPGTDAAATWRPCFGGPLTVHPISDPHLDEASVEAARREILRHLTDPEGS